MAQPQAQARIALASDIRIATEDARIAFLFVKVGLSEQTWRAYAASSRRTGPTTDSLHGRFYLGTKRNASAYTTRSSHRLLS